MDRLRKLVDDAEIELEEARDELSSTRRASPLDIIKQKSLKDVVNVCKQEVLLRHKALQAYIG